jgi:hypothetical protein
MNEADRGVAEPPSRCSQQFKRLQYAWVPQVADDKHVIVDERGDVKRTQGHRPTRIASAARHGIEDNVYDDARCSM